MKAKKCDRCGKLYECNDRETLKLAKVFPGSYRNNKGYDLCPECLSELKKWFDKGKSNE